MIAVLVLLALLAPASWLARLGASKMEFFHLRSVSVEGTRYVSPEDVLARLALDTTRSVWDDTKPLAARLRSMPQVADVRIARKLPGTLVITISENVPIALAPSPRGLEPVDTAGNVLPIDLTRTDLDLPVVAQRDAPILSFLGAVRAGQPAVYRRISDVARDGRTDLVLRIDPLDRPKPPVGERSDSASISGEPEAAQHVRVAARLLRVRVPLGVSVSRLADIFPVESDLMRRRANVAELDLRYRDQVIARLQ